MNEALLWFPRSFSLGSVRDPTREKFPRGPYLLSSYSFLSSLWIGGLTPPVWSLTDIAILCKKVVITQPLITGEKSPLLSEEQSHLFSLSFFLSSFGHLGRGTEEVPCVKSATKLEHIIQVENPPFGLSLPRI